MTVRANLPNIRRYLYAHSLLVLVQPSSSSSALDSPVKSARQLYASTNQILSLRGRG